MKRLIVPSLVVAVFAAAAAFFAGPAASDPSTLTYTFYCDSIGLGTIDAVVVATSADDAFHVTDVVGGDGTVTTANVLIRVSSTINGSTNTIPGFTKNGATTFTCPYFSGRLRTFGVITFIVTGG